MLKEMGAAQAAATAAEFITMARYQRPNVFCRKILQVRVWMVPPAATAAGSETIASVSWNVVSLAETKVAQAVARLETFQDSVVVAGMVAASSIPGQLFWIAA